MRLKNQLPEPVIMQNTTVYDDYYKDGIIDGWEHKDKLFNFTYLTRIERLTSIALQGKSILDVGCGTGDFFPFLQTFGVKKYLGVDIYPPALNLAKKKFSKADFINEDILNPKFRKKFDYVFCSGALSIRLETINNYDFLAKMLVKMWRISKIGIAFNLLSDEDKDPDQHLFYYTMKRVETLCKKINAEGKIVIKKTPIPTEGRLDNMQYHVFMYRQ